MSPKQNSPLSGTVVNLLSFVWGNGNDSCHGWRVNHAHICVHLRRAAAYPITRRAVGAGRRPDGGLFVQGHLGETVHVQLVGIVTFLLEQAVVEIVESGLLAGGFAGGGGGGGGGQGQILRRGCAK